MVTNWQHNITPPGTNPLQLLVHAYGTDCLPLSHRQAPWPFSKTIEDLFIYNGI